MSRKKHWVRSTNLFKKVEYKRSRQFFFGSSVDTKEDFPAGITQSPINTIPRGFPPLFPSTQRKNSLTSQPTKWLQQWCCCQSQSAMFAFPNPTSNCSQSQKKEIKQKVSLINSPHPLSLNHYWVVRQRERENREKKKSPVLSTGMIYTICLGA
jgi:hypothetical protein